ncbi:MAG: 6-carboxytetrahydropterin synthase [Proteobacteria bacterium]|nr:6-carboxytetrahydropterin synthase [Pseudomonadota bacterium]
MENRQVNLTRVYQLSAAHYLKSPFLSEEENKKTYGKCGQVAGHGHNYIIRVTVKGPIDAVTGMVTDVAELDKIVRKYVIDPLDHRNLNIELSHLSILTTEMFIQEIWKRLKPHITQVELYSVEVDETRKNGFQYFGAGH